MSVISLINFFFPAECIICRTNYAEKHHRYICKECASEIAEINSFNNTLARCIKCGCFLISEIQICIRCRQNKSFNFNSNYSIWSYKNRLIKKLIHNYKFAGVKEAAHFLASEIYEIYRIKYPGLPVVPAPCSRKRIKKYGWDHMKIISDILKKKYKVEIYFLFSKKKTRDQKELNYEERQKSLENNIIINTVETEKCLKKSSKIVIIDDVFTTGATSDYCSKLLISSNFKIVDIITIAID